MHRETDCKTLFKVLILVKKTLFARVCCAAAFRELVSVGMRYKTIPDVDDGYGGRTPACREHTYPPDQANSRVYAAIPRNTIIGPVLHVNMVKCLDNCGIKIPIHSTATQDQTSWAIIYRGKDRYVENLPLENQGRVHTSSELLLERFFANSNEPCDVEMESFSASIEKPIATRTEKSVEGIGKTHVNQVVEQPKPVDNEEFTDVS